MSTVSCIQAEVKFKQSISKIFVVGWKYLPRFPDTRFVQEGGEEGLATRE